MQETQFLIALLENGTTSKQTCLQLLAAEHLYIPTLLPRLQSHVKRLKQIEKLEQAYDTEQGFFSENQSTREYDV
jgi:hypothetical protein